MLTSLLPGFRQVRAPLVSGALIVAVFYLVMVDFVVEKWETKGAIDSGLRRLNDYMGRSGWAIVLAIASYMIGSLYVWLTSRLSKTAAERWTRRAINTSDDLTDIGSSFLRPFTRRSIQRLQYFAADCHQFPTSVAETPRFLTALICWDIVQDDFGSRLIVTNKEVFGEYDRLRSEAELRNAVCLPLFLLSCVALANIEIQAEIRILLTACTALISGLLFLLALVHGREARSIYAYAVANQIVSTTTLDRI